MFHSENYRQMHNDVLDELSRLNAENEELLAEGEKNLSRYHTNLMERVIFTTDNMMNMSAQEARLELSVLMNETSSEKEYPGYSTGLDYDYSGYGDDIEMEEVYFRAIWWRPKTVEETKLAAAKRINNRLYRDGGYNLSAAVSISMILRAIDDENLIQDIVDAIEEYNSGDSS